MIQNRPPNSSLESALRLRIQKEEAAFAKRDRAPDSLFDHLERVAALAERIAEKEGVPKDDSRLAGLFHDAGKFNRGEYHKDDRPEEERSCEVLDDLGAAHGLERVQIERVSEAIRQLYRDDPEPDRLAQVLFDADNLDKLGHLGVANYFVKRGLRGGGISLSTLLHLTVELTYARHAPRCLHTATGRKMAAQRALESTEFFSKLIASLGADGLYSIETETVVFNGLELDVASPSECVCGNSLERRIWEVAGMKCTEIHLAHACRRCGFSHELRFCRPRLVG